jgi:hypothetical protein
MSEDRAGFSRLIGSTTFSEDRVYRYTLWRTNLQQQDQPNHPRFVMFIGLNPSTADEIKDDNTIRQCIAFAKAWGYPTLLMTNLFAYRATKRSDMKKAKTPIGPDNEYWLSLCARFADRIVMAWGTDGKHRDRGLLVRALLRREYPDKLYHLGLNDDRSPRHPLYLSHATKLVRYEP